jgi:hypothetical protein
MSYDLIFWRGVTAECPQDVLAKFGRGEAVDGIEPLERAHVIATFNEVFEGEIRVEPASDEYGDYLQGWMFELRLREPLRCLWVHCAWDILKQPQLLQKLAIAGHARLGCHMYNPQIDDFLPADQRDQ